MRRSRLGRCIPGLVGLATLGLWSEPLFAQIPPAPPPNAPSAPGDATPTDEQPDAAAPAEDPAADPSAAAGADPMADPTGAMPMGATPGGALPPTFVGGFGSHHTGGANMAFGDGSVRLMSSGTTLKVLQLLGHRSDGGLLNGADY